MSNQQTTTTANQTENKTASGRETHNSMSLNVADIKFNKYNVTNKATRAKARIFYSLDNRVDGRKCVTLYAKDYDHALREMIPDAYENDTDTQSDCFYEGRAVLFESHPLYAVARLAAETFSRR